jgi:hypothetical protein
MILDAIANLSFAAKHVGMSLNLQLPASPHKSVTADFSQARVVYS